MTLKMAIKALFAPKEAELKIKDNRNNHTFTEEDREHAVEMRRLRQETTRMREKMQLLQQKRELEELKAELYEDDEDDEDDDKNDILALLAPILSNIKGGNTFAGQSSNSQQPPQSPPNPQLERTFTDDEIREMLKNQNKLKLKIAKKMNKEDLKNKIRENMPVTDADFERAHEILIKEF